VKNLPSFCLLIGYSGYTVPDHIPYILFKLEEIKKDEVISLRQYALKAISYAVHSHPFSP
jgi:hypothetical protein